MNKYLSLLCVTAVLVCLPACKTKREKKIEACQRELNECNEGIKKERKVLEREKAKLKNCAKTVYADAVEAENCEQTVTYNAYEK